MPKTAEGFERRAWVGALIVQGGPPRGPMVRLAAQLLTEGACLPRRERISESQAVLKA